MTTVNGSYTSAALVAELADLRQRLANAEARLVAVMDAGISARHDCFWLANQARQWEERALKAEAEMERLRSYIDLGGES